MNVTIKRLAWVVSAGILLAQAAPVLADALTEKYAAQNKLLAMRAARVDAMRKLAERINGLVITSETTVKDFVATSDVIQSSMMSWLRGMKEVGEPVFTPDGICQVTLEVTVQEIVVELPGGQEIVSVITKSSAHNLGLAKGKSAYAVIKASNVMIAVD